MLNIHIALDALNHLQQMQNPCKICKIFKKQGGYTVFGYFTLSNPIFLGGVNADLDLSSCENGKYLLKRLHHHFLPM